MSEGEFLLYQAPDGKARIQLRVAEGTVWLTQRQLAELYQVSVPAIALHIRKVFQERALRPEATVKEYLLTRPKNFVTPATAGAQQSAWIPAFAGMTTPGNSGATLIIVAPEGARNVDCHLRQQSGPSL